MPDFVHVLVDGRIVRSGGKELALELEQKGYAWLRAGGGRRGAGVRGAGDRDRRRPRDRTPPELESALAVPQPEWLRALRTRAFESFAERGFPRPGEEDWRFTNVAPVARTRFARRTASGAVTEADAGRGAPRRLPRAGLRRRPFRAGAVVAGRAARGRHGRRLVGGERAADWAPLESDLGRHADIVTQPFAALATALFPAAAVLDLGAGRDGR